MVPAEVLFFCVPEGRKELPVGVAVVIVFSFFKTIAMNEPTEDAEPAVAEEENLSPDDVPATDGEEAPTEETPPEVDFDYVDLMLDANEVYDVPTAIRAAHLTETFNIRWLEEPVHWYDRVTGLGQVAASTYVPISSG